MNRQPLTKARAKAVLAQALEDVNQIRLRRFDDMEEIHRVLGIVAEVYEGVTGEDAPEFVTRMEQSA